MDKEFLIKIIDNLQEEIKRLKKKNDNTIKISVNFNEEDYEIDTQIKNKMKEMKYYYLADDYKKPTKVKFMRYDIGQGFNGLTISAEVLNLANNKFELYHPKNLYESASKASDKYIKTKYKKS